LENASRVVFSLTTMSFRFNPIEFVATLRYFVFIFQK
jgi:hypothetical protein